MRCEICFVELLSDEEKEVGLCDIHWTEEGRRLLAESKHPDDKE